MLGSLLAITCVSVLMLGSLLAITCVSNLETKNVGPHLLSAFQDLSKDLDKAFYLYLCPKDSRHLQNSPCKNPKTLRQLTSLLSSHALSFDLGLD